MTRQRIVRSALRIMVALGGGGLMFAEACTSEQVQQAIVAGLDTATNQLLNPPDDDISFGDWLASELQN